MGLAVPGLAAFEGTWRTLRVIRHADGAVARFMGETVWATEGDGLRAVETGTLCQDGQRFEARRESVWCPGADGIDIHFGDGRFFHRLSGTGRAVHDCAPDLYRLRYDFSAWPWWSVRWHVTGPRKAYRAVTRYSRVSGG